MGKKCCVPKCKSGYDSVTFDPSIKISFHAFPPDSELRSEWKINISRPNWEPSPSSSVCSLHFHENDFQNSSTDGNKQRKDSRPNGWVINNSSNFCPILISIEVLFTSDNSFWVDDDKSFSKVKIIFLSQKNKLSDVNKTYIEIRIGQKFEL